MIHPSRDRGLKDSIDLTQSVRLTVRERAFGRAESPVRGPASFQELYEEIHDDVWRCWESSPVADMAADSVAVVCLIRSVGVSPLRNLNGCTIRAMESERAIRRLYYCVVAHLEVYRSTHHPTRPSVIWTEEARSILSLVGPGTDSADAAQRFRTFQSGALGSAICHVESGHEDGAYTDCMRALRDVGVIDEMFKTQRRVVSKARSLLRVVSLLAPLVGLADKVKEAMDQPQSLLNVDEARPY